MIENSCDSLDLSTIQKYRVTHFKRGDQKVVELITFLYLVYYNLTFNKIYMQPGICRNDFNPPTIIKTEMDID